MRVSLADQLNAKLVCDDKDFRAAIMTGELGDVHKEFYGPTPNDMISERLSYLCQRMKIDESVARRAIKRGTLKAWKSEGVWYTKGIEIREWRENFPCNEKRSTKS